MSRYAALLRPGTRRRVAAALVAVLLAAPALGGCEDDLPKATEITHMRVLGATLQVVGAEAEAEGRATPHPGERVRVSLATVFPSLKTPKRRIRALLLSCTAPDRYTGGIPICQELIDVATGVTELPEDLPVIDEKPFECPDAIGPVLLGGALSLSCTEGEPVAEFPVPKDYKRDRLLFSGVVCEHGNAQVDPLAEQPFGCSDPEVEPLRVHGLIPVAHGDDDDNHNPDLSGFSITREQNGKWEPVDPALLVPENEEDCLNLSKQIERDSDPENDALLPLLYGHIDLRLSYEADKREVFEGEPETLEITLYVTRGSVERRFTLFDANDEPRGGLLSSVLRYTAPKEDIPANGGLLRFYATLRDQRGGFAISEYAICLGP